MSYEIFYDKRFIKVGEDKFIPIFQTGSNNTWEYNYSGREIPEKSWSCINYPHKDRYVFSEKEIMEMAEVNKKFDTAKARNRFMSEEEVVRMYKNGVKAAKSLEYYTELGNSFRVSDSTDYYNPITSYPKTTKDLLETIKRLQADDKVTSIRLGFTQRTLILPKKNTIKKERQYYEQDYYYVLVNGGRTLVELRKRGYAYTFSEYGVKKFKSQKEADRYLEKYKDRLSDFKSERIDEVYTYMA